MSGSDSGTAAEITKLILKHRTVIFGYISTKSRRCPYSICG